MRFSISTLALVAPLALAAPSGIRLSKRDAEDLKEVVAPSQQVTLGHGSTQTVIGGLKADLLEKIESILKGEDEDKEEEVTVSDLKDDTEDDEEDSTEDSEDEKSSNEDEEAEEDEETEDNESEEASDDETEETEESDDTEDSEVEVEETEISAEDMLALENEYYTSIYKESFEPLRRQLEQHISMTFSLLHFHHCESAETALEHITDFIATQSADLWELTTEMDATVHVEKEEDRDGVLAELCGFLCKLGVAGDSLTEKGEGVSELNHILINLRDALAGTAVTCPCEVENIFRQPKTIEERDIEFEDVEEDVDAEIEERDIEVEDVNEDIEAEVEEEDEE